MPNFREHMVFAITGSPTTNERYCWCPEGNSYGSILTPRNMGLGRLNHETSLERFYFCNASSGYPGFAPTVIFATPPDQVMALLADPTAAETKRFADWKANESGFRSHRLIKI